MMQHHVAVQARFNPETLERVLRVVRHRGDYDFSVVLLDHNKNQPNFSIPENFGDLHGNIFKHFIHSAEYKQHFKKPPVICLSVSSKDVYHRTGNEHPVLGW
jgi:hypothetical protein